MRAWQRNGAALMLAMLGLGAAAGAIERTKIPSFSLTDRQGRGRSSESLQRTGQWLLVVVHPSCKPCDAVLQAIAALPPEAAASRVVVVVGNGTDADLAAAIERFPSLASAEWLTGDSTTLTAALQLAAASAVFGVRGNMIEWSVSGVLTDSRDVHSIASSWLAGSTP